MDNKEIIKKIDQVISNIDLRIKNLFEKNDMYTHMAKEREKCGSIKKYHYELEKTNYEILKCFNQIRKSELFKKRCLVYKEYLNSLNTNDPIETKSKEYKFLKILQEETIFDYDSEIKELNQRSIVEKICNKEDTSTKKIKDLETERNKKLQIFSKQQFHIQKERQYSLDYLNYDTNPVVQISFRQIRKAR